MSREDSFKKLIRGETKGPIASIARGGLSIMSKLYGQGVTFKNEQFNKEKGVAHASVPVISVGNITAGGTGKTPMVSYIGKFLADQGKTPAILSRGYKAEDNRRNIVVSVQGELMETPEVSGDEAWLLAHMLPGVNVLIGRNRSISADIAVNNLHSEVLILDDGFQHRALGRDLDIVLIDATNPFGYEHVLPRGLLREPLDGLQRADYLVLTKTNQVSKESLQILRNRLRTMLPQIPISETVHAPKTLTLMEDWREKQYTALAEADKSYQELKLMAVSGIGNPQSFKETLEEVGYQVVKEYSFEDHHKYSENDLIDIWKEAFVSGVEGIVITEKDAVKLSGLLKNSELKMPVLVLGIGIEFTVDEDNFKRYLLETIEK